MWQRGMQRMVEIRAYGCPLCGRVAKTSAELLSQGCEGKHQPLITLSDYEKLEAIRDSVIAIGEIAANQARWLEGKTGA